MLANDQEVGLPGVRRASGDRIGEGSLYSKVAAVSRQLFDTALDRLHLGRKEIADDKHALARVRVCHHSAIPCRHLLGAAVRHALSESRRTARTKTSGCPAPTEFPSETPTNRPPACGDTRRCPSREERTRSNPAGESSRASGS